MQQALSVSELTFKRHCQLSEWLSWMALRGVSTGWQICRAECNEKAALPSVSIDHSRFDAKVGIAHILQDHALGVKERTVERDGGTPDFRIGVGLAVVERQDRMFQLVIE